MGAGSGRHAKICGGRESIWKRGERGATKWGSARKKKSFVGNPGPVQQEDVTAKGLFEGRWGNLEGKSVGGIEKSLLKGSWF